ncbi:MAG: T9SS type A sorting domain-containing protein, partial [Bacteroidia bacterium]
YQMMKKILLLLFQVMLLLSSINLFAQGRNHNWLIGYTTGIDTSVTSTKAWLQFDSNSVIVTPDNFKMPFWSAQGNISDENGNLLMASNGCWIADATGDTMLNGGGLNPSSYTTTWCNSILGLPYINSDVFLPDPSNSNKYYLLHQTGVSNSNFKSDKLYYTKIDMTLNGGLGGVIPGQKNQVIFQAGLNPGIAVCRHANGRDWWIITFKDSSDIVYKMELTPSSFGTVTTQSLGLTPYPIYLTGQKQFSPDGKKMSFAYFEGPTNSKTLHAPLMDFDRCTGQFSNTSMINYTDSIGGYALAFSSNSKYLYFGSFNKTYQVNTDTTNVQASMDTVAINDGYYSPYPPFQTDFWLMYLAANGKIYQSSGNGVIDMHYINYPDSEGMACDVQQHALHLPCYYVRGNVYHPNYYLGCDTTLRCPCLITGINNLSPPDFKFRIYPNPVINNVLNIGYLLPQNKSGLFQIYDITGKVVFKYPLPHWSNEQSFKLPQLADGVYNAVIISGNQRVSKTVAVIKQ